MQHESGGPKLEGPTHEPRTDPTLQHPRCVFQILKRHYARYTPEMVEQVCGVPQEQFLQVCEAWTANSGRERTTAVVYAVGWTQHSVGVQLIRSAAIIQLLLGQHGPARAAGSWRCAVTPASRARPTSPRCSTSCPATCRCPAPAAHSLEKYLDSFIGDKQKGFWRNADAYSSP